MRKYRKKQCLELLDTISNAHAEICRLIEKKKFQEAYQMLADLQQAAISLGNSIESSEGEGFVTIHYLEDYCEVLFQIGEKLNDGGSDAIKVKWELQRPLTKILSSINNDIPEQEEVVFLPYKASMWDSLESVWKKADADPACDAYVIPIPYYDRNPDGSFGELHYEADEYPEDVPVFDYHSYNFEERHPDKIYIHNPYDGNNYVTSIPTTFYSENLRRFTDDLVYIPYFVLLEPDETNLEAAMKDVEHFALTPGVINADHVIVQSEAMRQVYIKVLLKTFGDTKENRKSFEEKISGAGSPKVDKVINTKKEDLEIPANWLPVMKNPDGSWKKIIFYNTSVSALLQDTQAYLEKVCDVLNIFQKERENIALLWRPHPLMRATLESMRPELLAPYQAIVNQYINQGWGIYDDSPDVDRAIILSDAYYGDWSSVVFLYQKTKKPIMIENVKLLSTGVRKAAAK